MFIEPPATRRRTPAERHVPTLEAHITFDGVSCRGRIRTINIQLLTELRTFAISPTSFNQGSANPWEHQRENLTRTLRKAIRRELGESSSLGGERRLVCT